MLGSWPVVAIAHRLFQVHAVDPVTAGTVIVDLGVLAWLAALAPASSASRIEPMQALRHP
jgi:ABC-type lipoprotein release transport system permease subunit